VQEGDGPLFGYYNSISFSRVVALNVALFLEGSLAKPTPSDTSFKVTFYGYTNFILLLIWLMSLAGSPFSILLKLLYLNSFIFDFALFYSSLLICSLDRFLLRACD